MLAGFSGMAAEDRKPAADFQSVIRELDERLSETKKIQQAIVEGKQLDRRVVQRRKGDRRIQVSDPLTLQTVFPTRQPKD